ncbi:hypothetical protein ACFE04_029171 [Oxalis oulophora]
MAKSAMVLDSQETSPANVRRNISDPLLLSSPIEYPAVVRGGSGSVLPLPPRPPCSVLNRNLSSSSSCIRESPDEKVKMIKHCVKQLFQLCLEPESEGKIIRVSTQDQHTTINTARAQENTSFNTQKAGTISTLTDQYATEKSQPESKSEYELKLKREHQHEEGVIVEKRGGELYVEMKCICGESYHLLLSKGSCYYKIYHPADR